MRVTVDIVENGYVVAPQPGGQGERSRVYVAKNSLDLAEVFAGLQRDDELIEGRGPDGEYSGLLSSMKGAALSIVKSGEQIAGTLEETWEPLPSDLDGGADFGAEPEWPAPLPGPDSSTSADVPETEPPTAPADQDVAYVPAAEDGYEFPAVRGPLNGRREIQCPTHGWQTAVVRDGAYRCQFKPSPRQVCTNPGTPKEQAEKRMVPA